LALFSETSKNRPERLLDALPDLRRAEELNPQAVLAPYFMGLIYERSNRPTRAIAAYKRVYELFDECYPAVLGQARVLAGIGQESEAIDALKQLLSRFPDNILIKQHLARIYYAARDWSRAEQAIAEILQRDTQDPEFMLMQAHTLVEQGQFFKALVPLDRYAAFKPNDRLYLLLRAKVQAEGYHNRDAALTYLRGILKMFPMDEEASVYTAALLLESSRREHQIEGRELLRSLLAVEHSSLELVDLAFRDAVQREAWEDAQGYVDRLLQERRTQYLLSAAQVAQGLGNAAAAFSYAQEFHEQNPTSEEGTIAYIAALIDRGQRDEAQRLIESHLAGTEGAVKAQYYYLRSRIRGTEAEVLEDLRSSLFEDPRNLNALMAMVELYHRRKDQRRVVYYLKQALTFAPDNARLQQYEQEYLL
jgi:tetratricopeptide (TPR) repeat protein